MSSEDLMKISEDVGCNLLIFTEREQSALLHTETTGRWRRLHIKRDECVLYGSPCWDRQREERSAQWTDGETKRQKVLIQTFVRRINVTHKKVFYNL